MADYTQYPQSADIQAIYAATGLVIGSTPDYASAALAAAIEWESRVGWYPYLAAGSPSLRHFDPPSSGPKAGRLSSVEGGKELDLDGGLVSIPTINIGVIPGFSGTALVVDLQFYMQPNNALANGLAYTYVNFLTAVRGVPKSIGITGLWGRVTTVPADVWRVIQQRAASLVAPEIQTQISRGRVEAKTADMDYRFDPAGALAMDVKKWDSEFNRMVGIKKRV
jgi:hypothetical protein